jgi:hypothetical protein
MLGYDEPLITPKGGRSMSRVTAAAAIGLLLGFGTILSLAWQSAFVHRDLLLRSDWLLHVNYTTANDFSLPKPSMRCDFIIDQIMQHNSNHSNAMLRAKFRVQSRDVNSFYR